MQLDAFYQNREKECQDAKNEKQLMLTDCATDNANLGKRISAVQEQFESLSRQQRWDISWCRSNIDSGSFKSQLGQDRELWQSYFPTTCGGTFVEMGAADGITYSNSYVFEHDLGWKGLCIEPSPSAFKLLVQNRPNCTKYNVAIGSEEKNVTYVDVSGYSAQLSGIIKSCRLIF